MSFPVRGDRDSNTMRFHWVFSAGNVYLMHCTYWNALYTLMHFGTSCSGCTSASWASAMLWWHSKPATKANMNFFKKHIGTGTNWPPFSETFLNTFFLWKVSISIKGSRQFIPKGKLDTHNGSTTNGPHVTPSANYSILMRFLWGLYDRQHVDSRRCILVKCPADNASLS